MEITYVFGIPKHDTDRDDPWPPEKDYLPDIPRFYRQKHGVHAGKTLDPLPNQQPVLSRKSDRRHRDTRSQISNLPKRVDSFRTRLLQSHDAGMAVSKKYAGLPDLDPAPEIYETPDLTDDASTIQTNTLRTESPSPSEDGQVQENVDRARLNTEQARRRFEPMIVDAKDTNLSDAIGGNRKGYMTRHRRRRRGRREHGVTDEYGDLSGDSSEEEETLGKKLARLRREAEEIRLELARREQEGDEDEFKDSLEHHQDGNHPEDDRDIHGGVEELGRVLNGLKVTTRQAKGATLEEQFNQQLEVEHKNSKGRPPLQTPITNGASTTTPSSDAITAITAFADRLTALEKALGVSSISTSANTTSIMPTLDTLSSQISVLTTTITTQASSSTMPPNLETISERLKILQSESDNLLATRKAALQTLASLHDARHRGTNNSSVFAKYLSRREAQQRQRDSLTADGDNNNNDTTGAKDQSADAAMIEDQVFSDVFLDEQASKITALYNTLPTIQNLQPLLPVVLERLRGLSVVHASAATAHQDMEDLERRLRDWEVETKKWRDAVEGVERGIEDSKAIMKENVDVIGGMVRDVEGRLDGLEKTASS